MSKFIDFQSKMSFGHRDVDVLASVKPDIFQCNLVDI